MIELEDPPAVADRVPEMSAIFSSGEKFISFEIGDKLFCVAAASVQEVVHAITTASVPLAPRWLLGLGSVKGEPVAVIDPATVTNSRRSLATGKPKTVVFRSSPNHTQFALPIDSLREMITVDRLLLSSGEFVHDGRPITLIDHARLFNSFDEN